MLSSLSPGRRRLVLAVLVPLVLLAVAAAGTAVLQRDEVPGTVARDEPRPVLLVPGYGGGTAGLEVLADRLRDAGRTARVVGLPGDGRGDLREAAQALDDAAQAAVEAGAPAVDVVGYSAGGVIARWWAAEQGGADLARRIVTLGSPHHGAEVAGLGIALGPSSCPLGCQQLAPGSELLDRLNAGDETPDGPQWTTVWTEQDEVVTPPDSARLEGATAVVVQRVCPGTSLDHSGLLVSPLVAAVVLEALGPQPRTSYGPADCARLTA